MTTDKDTLEWAADWILDSLKGETNERVIEFARNMAVTLRAATLDIVSAPAPSEDVKPCSCDYRNDECVNDGVDIKGRWVCRNHLDQGDSGTRSGNVVSEDGSVLAAREIAANYEVHKDRCQSNERYPAPPCDCGAIEEIAAIISKHCSPATPDIRAGITWSALLGVLERLRSKNRNPENQWYHGWNAAIQCLINDINSRSAAPSARPEEGNENVE